MIEPYAIAGAGVVAGSIVAVSARDGRAVALGLLVAMVAAPLVASPLPDPPSAAAGILGAILAAYLLWASARDKRSSGAGSGIGWVAETAAAAAAFTVGLNVSMVDPLPGPIVAQAAGLALIALAVVPVMGRDLVRLSAGVILLVLGVSLLTAAWLGPTAPLMHLAMAALLVGVAGAASVVIAAQPAVLVAAGDAEVLGAGAGAAAVAVAVAGGTVAGGTFAASGPSAAAVPTAASTVRPRASRARERSKGLAGQASVWAPTEKSEVADAPAETTPPIDTSSSPTPEPLPEPAPATRPSRLSRRGKP